MKDALEVLEPYMEEETDGKLGTAVVATVAGDLHNIGKNIFVTLLEAQGFDVHDLGVNVDASRVIEKMKEVEPDLVGFSALITTAFASMKQTAEIIEEQGLRDRIKLMVGGGVTTPTLKTHIGADFQTTDAMEGVAYCLKTMEEKGRAQ